MKERVPMPEELNPVVSQNFIHNFIDEDIAQGAA